MPKREPDFWYITDADGLKFFRDEERISSAQWRKHAPKDRVDTLNFDLAAYPHVREAKLDGVVIDVIKPD